MNMIMHVFSFGVYLAPTMAITQVPELHVPQRLSLN